jgi:hypothetical protein
MRLSIGRLCETDQLLNFRDKSDQDDPLMKVRYDSGGMLIIEDKWWGTRACFGCQ